MIIFDNDKFLKDIQHNGISATDQMAVHKMEFYIRDLIYNSTYRKNKIIQKIKDAAKDYFSGLPDEIVDHEVEVLYENAKSKECKNEKKKILTLYKSEMQIIEELENDRLQRLAFAALVVHKFLGQYFINDDDERYYKSVKASKADIFRIAKMSDTSGKSKQQLLKKLHDRGLIELWVKTNGANKFCNKWIGFEILTVKFNADLKADKSDEEVYMRITNYDDVLLYLRYWLHDSSVGLCADCGCPIEITANAKHLCSDCAEKRKKVSDSRRYMQAKNSENLGQKTHSK